MTPAALAYVIWLQAHGDGTFASEGAGHADAHATLARNWRSDAGLLRALAAVFRGAALGDGRIVVRGGQLTDVVTASR